jgi:DNA-3-methyladenine glycosylase II
MPRAAKPAAPVAAESTGTIFEQATIDRAIEELSSRERRLAALLKKFPPEPRRPPANLFSALCYTVCAQMLSNAAAKSIFGRIETLCESDVCPEGIDALRDKKLREAGLSNAKVASMRSLADHFRVPDNALSRAHELPDEDVAQTLLGIRGLGPWSVEMFMMFSLGRPDIYSARDAALANGLIKLKRLAKDSAPKRLERLALKYRPYRSVVSLALWKWRHHNWEAL